MSGGDSGLKHLPGERGQRHGDVQLIGGIGVPFLDTMHHYPPNPLSKPWAQDPQSPVATFIETGELLVDKSNVDAFVSETSQKSQ